MSQLDSQPAILSPLLNYSCFIIIELQNNCFYDKEIKKNILIHCLKFLKQFNTFNSSSIELNNPTFTSGREQTLTKDEENDELFKNKEIEVISTIGFGKYFIENILQDFPEFEKDGILQIISNYIKNNEFTNYPSELRGMFGSFPKLENNDIILHIKSNYMDHCFIAAYSFFNSYYLANPFGYFCKGQLSKKAKKMKHLKHHHLHSHMNKHIDKMKNMNENCFIMAKYVKRILDETFGFVHQKDSEKGIGRDITGFEDGTENPPTLEEKMEAALTKEGDSFILAQKWVHKNLRWFHSLSIEEQESIIGRSKKESIEDENKLETSHVGRVSLENPETKEELEIVRQSMTYGNVKENGLYFFSYSSSTQKYTDMLESMVGKGKYATQEGHNDFLMKVSNNLFGGYFYVPSMKNLNALIGCYCKDLHSQQVESHSSSFRHSKL